MPTYISLKEAKEHLRVEPDFTDEDNYIEALIDAAEAVVAEDICTPLVEVETAEGVLPPPLVQAIKLMIGTFYDSRETLAFGVLVNDTKVYRHLIGLYRNYAR